MNDLDEVSKSYRRFNRGKRTLDHFNGAFRSYSSLYAFPPTKVVALENSPRVDAAHRCVSLMLPP
jgi:hypothetical protein